MKRLAGITSKPSLVRKLQECRPSCTSHEPQTSVDIDSPLGHAYLSLLKVCRSILDALNRAIHFTMMPDDHSQNPEQVGSTSKEETTVDQHAPDPDEGDLDDLDGELKHVNILGRGHRVLC